MYIHTVQLPDNCAIVIRVLFRFHNHAGGGNIWFEGSKSAPGSARQACKPLSTGLRCRLKELFYPIYFVGKPKVLRGKSTFERPFRIFKITPIYRVLFVYIIIGSYKAYPKVHFTVEKKFQKHFWMWKFWQFLKNRFFSGVQNCGVSTREIVIFSRHQINISV